MNLRNMFSKDSFKGAVNGIGMKLTAAKPEIMLILGTFSVLGGTVYACMKGEELKKALDEHKERQEEVKNMVAVDDNGDPKNEKIEKGKLYVKNYAHFSYELLKIYGIPALLWFGGMGMIFGSHGTLRKTNKHLIADGVAAKKLFDEYRERVAKAVGDEVEEKIFMGVQEGTVNVLEKDEKTGEEKVVKKKVDIFYAQPGSVFARNFTEETSDAFDIRSFADHYLEARVNEINTKLETGAYRAFNAIDIYRMLGFNENALTEIMDDDETMNMLLRYGISGNARKVQDENMRKLKVTRLRGYRKTWDVVRNMEIYVPCLRLDFNFYPLDGKI